MSTIRNYCSICDKQLSTGSAYSNHIKSKQHLIKLLVSQPFKETEQVLENFTNSLEHTGNLEYNKKDKTFDIKKSNNEELDKEFDEEFDNEEFDEEFDNVINHFFLFFLFFYLKNCINIIILYIRFLLTTS
jgi:hypothetical protein